MNELRKNLPPLPDRIKNLPVDARGYPIPWFVHTMPDGTRDFRIADSEKRVRAVRLRLCWICGEKLGRHLAFLIGPMCAVNRNTSEPACHLECAEFAAIACPFLTSPKAQYRRANLPEGSSLQPHSIPGNPGACCIWITRTFKPYHVEGGWLIRLGPAEGVKWYAEGKPATRAQILESLERRLPELAKMAAAEGPDAQAALAKQVDETHKLLPA